MKIINRVLEFIFPPRCPCCGKLNTSATPCDTCSAALGECRVKGKICRKCGLEVNMCECSKFNYLFSGMCAPFNNTGAARDGIYGLKFKRRPFAAEYFGKEIAACFRKNFRDINPDFICIVPTHKKTLSERNYDYVNLLAKAVARENNIVFKPGTVRKIRLNKRQHTLSVEERQANVKGAFAVRKNLSGKTVLLIDDIKTTGYTMNECAKQLRLAGAERVFCASALVTANNTCNSRKTKI